MSSTEQQPKSNRLTKIALWTIAAAVVITLLAVVFGDDETSSDDKADKKSSETTQTTNASEEKSDAPEEKTSPRDELIDAIEDIDGDADVKLAGGDLTVTYPLDNNISTGMMADVGKKTTLDIIGAVQDSDVNVPVLQVNAEAEMVDEYGEESTDNVVSATYSKRIINKIVVDTVSVDDIWTLADIETFVHPEFQ